MTAISLPSEVCVCNDLACDEMQLAFCATTKQMRIFHLHLAMLHLENMYAASEDPYDRFAANTMLTIMSHAKQVDTESAYFPAISNSLMNFSLIIQKDAHEKRKYIQTDQLKAA